MWHDSPFVWRICSSNDAERAEASDDGVQDEEFVIVEGRATTYRDREH